MTVSTILKTSGILKVGPDDTLGSVLKQLSSSYDAAFVFSEKGKYLGVICPYYVSIQRTYPPTTKIKKCLTHAPRLSSTHTIEHAAAMMAESKIHYLPVFYNTEFVGIVTAHRILQATRELPQMQQPVKSLIQKAKPRPLIGEKDPLTKALHLFQTKKQSKLIVIKENNKLAGVLSFYDVIDYVQDQQTRMPVGSRVGEKKDKLDKPVSHFYKTKVLTVKPERSIADCASLIVKENIGSVIVVTTENIPLGIVTTDDIFSLITPLDSRNMIGHFYHNLNAHSKMLVDSFMEKTIMPLSRRSGVGKIMFKVKQERQGERFEVTADVDIPKGKPIIVKKEGIHLPEVLKNIKLTVKERLGKK